MHHLAKVTLGRADYKKYNIQCSCGTGGDFGGRSEAMEWMAMNHFRTLGGVNTCEMQDLTPPDPVVEEAAPATETEVIPPAGEDPVKEENLGAA